MMHVIERQNRPEFVAVVKFHRVMRTVVEIGVVVLGGACGTKEPSKAEFLASWRDATDRFKSAMRENFETPFERPSPTVGLVEARRQLAEDVRQGAKRLDPAIERMESIRIPLNEPACADLKRASLEYLKHLRSTFLADADAIEKGLARRDDTSDKERLSQLDSRLRESALAIGADTSDYHATTSELLE